VVLLWVVLLDFHIWSLMFLVQFNCNFGSILGPLRLSTWLILFDSDTIITTGEDEPHDLFGAGLDQIIYVQYERVKQADKIDGNRRDERIDPYFPGQGRWLLGPKRPQRPPRRPIQRRHERRRLKRPVHRACAAHWGHAPSSLLKWLKASLCKTAAVTVPLTRPISASNSYSL